MEAARQLAPAPLRGWRRGARFGGVVGDENSLDVGLGGVPWLKVFNSQSIMVADFMLISMLSRGLRVSLAETEYLSGI
jgi:hypothetical protein